MRESSAAAAGAGKCTAWGSCNAVAGLSEEAVDHLSDRVERR
jgi:hypothetical protein